MNTFKDLLTAIIVGSGIASFKIIRNLVEKLPIMVALRWLNTKSQPIAICNVIQYLMDVLFNKDYFQGYDQKYCHLKAMEI